MGRDPGKPLAPAGRFSLLGESRGQAAHVLLLPRSPLLQHRFPGLGLPANEKEEKTLLCVKAKLGEREGKGKKKREKKKEKEKKKDNVWVVCSGDF